MISRDQYLAALEVVKNYRLQIEQDLNMSNFVNTKITKETKLINSGLSRKIITIFDRSRDGNDCVFGVAFMEFTIQDLINVIDQKGYSELAKLNSMGKKSLNEIKLLISSI